MTALAATLDRTTESSGGKLRAPAVAVETCSRHPGRPAVITTPDVDLTRPWSEALFGLRLDLQSRHRSDGTITNRLCSATIMARHAIAAGLDRPADVTYMWLAQGTRIARLVIRSDIQ
jgi:hypothetical protein